MVILFCRVYLFCVHASRRYMTILINISIIPGVPGSMIDVNVIPYTVLMLITWKEIENNGGSPITNITIRYKNVDDKISNDKWNILHVDPSKVKMLM